MNNNEAKFDVIKIRILCYVFIVNNKERDSFLIKKFLFKKINKRFREMHS